MIQQPRFGMSSAGHNVLFPPPFHGVLHYLFFGTADVSIFRCLVMGSERKRTPNNGGTWRKVSSSGLSRYQSPESVPRYVDGEDRENGRPSSRLMTPGFPLISATRRTSSCTSLLIHSLQDGTCYAQIREPDFGTATAFAANHRSGGLIVSSTASVIYLPHRLQLPLEAFKAAHSSSCGRYFKSWAPRRVMC